MPSYPVDMRLFRFLVVGCTNVIVSLLVFYLFFDLIGIGAVLLDSGGYAGSLIKQQLKEYHIDSIDGAISSIIAYAAGTINSFVLNKLWTFKDTRRSLPQLKKFIVINLASLSFAVVCIFIFVDSLGYSYVIVWALTIMVTTVFNYVCSRYWIFSSSAVSVS